MIEQLPSYVWYVFGSQLVTMLLYLISFTAILSVRRLLTRARQRIEST